MYPTPTWHQCDTETTQIRQWKSCFLNLWTQNRWNCFGCHARADLGKSTLNLYATRRSTTDRSVCERSSSKTLAVARRSIRWIGIKLIVMDCYILKWDKAVWILHLRAPLLHEPTSCLQRFHHSTCHVHITLYVFRSGFKVNELKKKRLDW